MINNSYLKIVLILLVVKSLCYYWLLCLLTNHIVSRNADYKMLVAIDQNTMKYTVRQLLLKTILSSMITDIKGFFNTKIWLLKKISVYCFKQINDIMIFTITLYRPTLARVLYLLYHKQYI